MKHASIITFVLLHVLIGLTWMDYRPSQTEIEMWNPLQIWSVVVNLVAYNKVVLFWQNSIVHYIHENLDMDIYLSIYFCDFLMTHSIMFLPTIVLDKDTSERYKERVTLKECMWHAILSSKYK